MLTDIRIRALLIQAALVAIVFGGAMMLISATVANLSARGIPLGFSFLFAPANFSISETILPYKPQDPNWWAIVVGIANTLFVSALVIIAASILGLLVGIGRLSSNPLVSGATRVWVEIARNTPVIILLIFVYALWWKVLPPVREAINPLHGVYLSLRGLALPKVDITWPSALILMLLFSLFALGLAHRLALRRHQATGHRPAYVVMALLGSLVALTATAILTASLQPSNGRGPAGRTSSAGFNSHQS